jgi:transposase InsO family protein
LRDTTPPPPTERNAKAAQRLAEQRRQELVRQHAVALASEIAAVGYTKTETAQLLHITDRTLRQWQHNLDQAIANSRPTGRPAVRSSVLERNRVIHYLDEFGPGVGVWTLREAFPNLGRNELDDLLHRYRRVWRLNHRQPIHVLEWTQPGTVWAMDFAEAPNIIDGIGKYLLAVRDLASGRHLLWLPLRDATSPAAAEALANLLVIFGPPLVLKSDNGSAFGAPAVATLLNNFGIMPLFSPPHTPSYNGSIEAGIGSLKARTAAHAARHGHPGTWTLDDAFAALEEANAYARPHGPQQPSPNEFWRARTSIAVAERLSFQQLVEAHRCGARQELELPPEGDLPPMSARQVDRLAIRRALVEHGELIIRRSSIPPRIPRPKPEVVS